MLCLLKIFKKIQYKILVKLVPPKYWNYRKKANNLADRKVVINRVKQRIKVILLLNTIISKKAIIMKKKAHHNKFKDSWGKTSKLRVLQISPNRILSQSTLLTKSLIQIILAIAVTKFK